MENSVVNDLKVFAKNLRVLVVEDEKDINSEFCSTLNLFFLDVISASNGLEALEIYKRNEFDIVITDVNMPFMNGVELSRQLRILNKEQVIIVISGYIDTFVIDLIETGIQALIMKPYKLDKFLLTLLKQCENIVFKKEFEKLKLHKLNQKLSDGDDRRKPSPLEHIAQELISTQSKSEHIDKIKGCFRFLDGVDDSMLTSINSDIDELNEEFEDLLNSILLHGIEESHSEDFLKILKGYCSIFELLSLPKELIIVFKRVVENLNLLEFNEESYEKIYRELEILNDDILKLFRALLVDKSLDEFNLSLKNLIHISNEILDTI